MSQNRTSLGSDRWSRLARRAGALTLAGGLALGLGGCEDMYRQDPLLVRGSTAATVFSDSPIYIDRPLAQNLDDSLVFKDYVVLMQRAGLFGVLRGPGPYTVFALINPAIEGIPQLYRDRMLAPQNAAGLHELMAYTVVPGRYTASTIVDMIRKGGGQSGLRTIDGAMLGVRLDPTGKYIRLYDPAGRVSMLRLADIRQSNGLLYAGSTLLAPN